jgi:hypothetical protein
MRTGHVVWSGSLVLTAALLAAPGCSGEPKVAEVSGTVMVDGKPIDKGTISFFPVDGKGQTAGGEIKDGKYSVKDVSIGVMKVEIRWPYKTGKKQKDYDAPGGKWYYLEDESLPEKYNDATDLKFEVKPGTNQKDWVLTGRKTK